MKDEILVIGGTGTIGETLVELLRENDINYRLLVRSETTEEQLKSQGVPCVRGALGDWRAVEAALTNVDAIFLLTSPSPEMFELHQGLIDRAVKASVRKITRLSAEPAHAGSDMPMYDLHGRADDYLKRCDIEYVILRPHYFMQNVLTMHAPFIKESSTFAQYLGDARIPMVDSRDIARVAFHCLTTDEFNNETYIITGPRAISFTDVAKALSKSLDRDIQYVSLSYEDQEKGFKAAGIPEWIVESTLKLFRTWVETPEHKVSPDFEKITKTRPTDIEKFAADFADSF